MFKIRFKERLFIIFFACFLAIYPPTVKYQEVQALEWAIPTVAFDTALKFLLGLLGVSITSKALHDNVDWSEVRQNCIDYQVQQGNDAVAVGQWWEDVAKGTLNQASACWSAFKEWVKTQLSSDDVLTVSTEYKSAIKSICNINFSDSAFPYKLGFTCGVAMVNTSSSQAYFYFFNQERCTIKFEDNYTLAVTKLTDGTVGFRVPDDKAYYPLNTTSTYAISAYPLDAYYSAGYVGRYGFSATNDWQYYFYNMDFPSVANYHTWNPTLDDVPANEGIFDSANDNVTDTAITTDDTTTTAIPDTLPLPWDNVSDTAEGVSDAIDALQEQVAEGVISLEEFWERVQEMVNALAIDTTTEETLPVTQDPDTGESEKLPDKVKENVSNTAFTLSGLEKVFPFCIPWDIYGFVTLLVAEPVAPVINYPIYNPVTNKDINITIDFSEWETVVVLFRYILDFLLIIGLLLLARQLAGAGGDD